MRFHFSKHVNEELERRKIPRALMDQVLQAPEQKVPEVDNITCYQSRVEIGGKLNLLRVMVNETVNPPVVVTVYRTNKISRYWRKP
jgi:catabolite regulation protein CreA